MTQKMMLGRVLVLLTMLYSVGSGFGQASFIRSYELPGETITAVRTIKPTNYFVPYFLVLEGVNQSTNTAFTKVLTCDSEGNLLDGYEDAYVGEPLTLSSGIFDVYNYFSRIQTPTIEYTEQQQQYFFRWRYGFADHNEDGWFNGVYLPDSIQSIVDFPTVIRKYYVAVFASYYYLVGGRAVINGVNKCFLLKTDHLGQLMYPPVVYFPHLTNISGITRTGSYYLAIGKAEDWGGKIVLVDDDSNLIWEQTFTNAADVAYDADFTTPLLATHYSPIVISYQNMDRKMHLARYLNQALEDIFTLQLESFVGAIPIAPYDSLVAFAYIKNNKQYISQINFEGNVRWTTELPGIGNFGKDCLSITSSSTGMCYLIGGVMDGGGFYLAKIDMLSGRIDYDTISKPLEQELSCYPNPNQGDLNISFSLKKAGKINLEIYNLKGQKVAKIKDEIHPSGKFIVHWTMNDKGAKRLPAGIYLISLNQDGIRKTTKVFLK